MGLDQNPSHAIKKASAQEPSDVSSLKKEGQVTRQQDSVSQWMTKTFVSTAVSIKQSPLPDIFSLTTDLTLESYKKLDNLIGINNRIINLSQNLVKSSVVAGGVLASAAIKAGVAYQRTPGYLDQHSHDESNDNNPRIVIRRIATDTPGGFPQFSDVIDVSTQTNIEPEKVLKRKKSVGDYMFQAAQSAHHYGVTYMKGNEQQLTRSEIPENHYHQHHRTIKPKKSFISLFYNPSTQTPTITEEEGLSSLPDSENATIKGDSKSSTIKLNVGGLKYEFSIFIFEPFAESAIGQYFKNEHFDNETDPDSNIFAKHIQKLNEDEFFLDFDGISFYYILNYLRNVKEDRIDQIKQLSDMYLLHQILNLSNICGLEELFQKIQRHISHIRLQKNFGIAYTISSILVTFFGEVTYQMSCLFCAALNAQNRLENIEAFGQRILELKIIHSIVQFGLIVLLGYLTLQYLY